MAEIDTSPEPPRLSDSPFGWFASRYRVLLLRRAARRFAEILRYATVRPPAKRKFHIVSAQRNMGDTVLRCLDSVHSQDYPKDLIERSSGVCTLLGVNSACLATKVTSAANDSPLKASTVTFTFWPMRRATSSGT